MQHLAGGMARSGMLAPGTKARFPPRGQREAVLLKTGILGVEDTVRTVLALDLLHLLGNGVQRLFPANLYEVTLARTLLAHALHGVEQTGLSVQLLFPGMAHGARAHLHIALPGVLPTAVLTAIVGVHRVIGLNRNELAVLGVALQHTGRVPTAISRARRVEDALTFSTVAAGVDDSLFVHRFLLVSSLNI